MQWHGRERTDIMTALLTVINSEPHNRFLSRCKPDKPSATDFALESVVQRALSNEDSKQAIMNKTHPLRLCALGALDKLRNAMCEATSQPRCILPSSKFWHLLARRFASRDGPGCAVCSSAVVS